MPFLIVAVAAALVGLVIFMPKSALGYVKGQSFNLELVEIEPGFFLAAEPARAYFHLRTLALSRGVTWQIDSAFRTMEKQTELYQGYIAGLPGFNKAAEPGHSTHQSGDSIDFNLYRQGRDSPLYVWLTANAPNFGFVNDVASEPWHWTYKGV